MVYFAYMRMLTSFHTSWDHELSEFSCYVFFTCFFPIIWLHYHWRCLHFMASNVWSSLFEQNIFKNRVRRAYYLYWISQAATGLKYSIPFKPMLCC